MIVEGFALVPDGKECRPVDISGKGIIDKTIFTFMSWSFKPKDWWEDCEFLSTKSALGKWEYKE